MKTSFPQNAIALIRLAPLFMLTICAYALSAPAHAASGEPQLDVALDKKTLEMIQEATFEVVMKKPEHDSLTYEKPLPMNLLPYAVRNDKYYSVGTAFAIAPNQFISAVHVLNLGSKSQFTNISLRDKSGAVYPIDQILKYSSRRDFAVFTIRGRTARQFFNPNTQPELNEKVYAVGNAYGEGIVIRDGLYTSNTPEERDGAWKWIRFSAAASPGNSGGPLLDSAGNLIGIVQAKSENENLNYALPISEVMIATEGLAAVDVPISYRSDNMPISKDAVVKREIALPKSYGDLNRELIRLFDEESNRLMASTVEENRANIFPNGAGSTKLLHNASYITFFPGIIAMGDDGIWSVYKPGHINKAELGANGFLSTGDIEGSTYFHLRLPDNMSLRDVTGSSRTLMDLFLKGASHIRKIGPERVKIVSMGKAHDETVFSDSYQRKWLMMTWPIEFDDQELVMMALPTPDGLVGAVQMVDTGRLASQIRDMKALADFIYVSYYATLAQWETFLSMKDLLPAAFSNIQIGFEPGKEFHYQSKRLDFSYPSSLMKVTDHSDLQLGFSFFSDGGRVIWDVSRVAAGEDKNNKNSFVVVREAKPSRDMNDDDIKFWTDLTNRRHPFDRISYFHDDQTVIGMVLPDRRSPPLTDAEILYAIIHLADGVIQPAEAAEKLDGFVRGIKLYEHLYAKGKDDGVATNP